MLFEMARDKLDREWSIPHIDNLIEQSQTINKQSACMIYRRMIDNATLEIRWSRFGGVARVSSPSGSLGSDFHAFELIYRLYRKAHSRELFDLFVNDCLKDAVQRSLSTKGSRAFDAVAIEERLKLIFGTTSVGPNTAWKVDVEMSSELAEMLELMTPISEFIDTIMSIKKEIEKRVGVRSSSRNSLSGFSAAPRQAATTTEGSKGTSRLAVVSRSPCQGQSIA